MATRGTKRSNSAETKPLPAGGTDKNQQGDQLTKEKRVKVAHTAQGSAPKARAAVVVRMQRKAGQVVQDCDVYIGRRWTMGGWNLPQSKWANPFTVRKAGSAAEAVRLYEEEHLSQRPDLMAALTELRGKRLGCWCKKKPTDPCHGDVLVRLSNALVSGTEHNPTQYEEQDTSKGDVATETTE
jgi:hypothetical protein